ncbi:WD40 repeat-like protein [Tuber magnatum]|uniref:WD40 repeat-like protein n=1 Tax=Tuber magnatum TaxID=42249 RepID=A0A317SZJ0_9PEZI|nr:WD40 repeat-like protein [Tuber magnatum]
MTHVSLHRCRFIDFPPSQITALAFSHPSAPASPYPPPKNLRLAIGRANGSIEIWNPLSGAWVYESTLAGGKDRSIEGLTWIQDHDSHGRGLLRLFSIGYSSVVTEWDIATGRPRTHTDCNGGVIWSIAAQPQLHSSEKVNQDDQEACAQKIAVGMQDGTLTILSTAGGKGALSYIKTLMRAGTSKSRVLSMVWQNRHTVVSGMADSTIRVWDIRTGRAISRLSLNKDRGRDVLVWAVRALPNGDLVSADSRGEVCFWDGDKYALKQRIKGHHGDCLALEVGGISGDTVISGGVDMKTILYKHTGEVRKWGQVTLRRFHKHDVRAMAAYECGKFSVIASGGVDMTPIIIPLRQFFDEAQLEIPAVPQSPIVTSVPESRLIMSWWEREVKIWRIQELGYDEKKGDELYLFPGEEEGRGRKLLSRIVLANDEYITSASISSPIPQNGGHVLAVSTIAEVKLFLLRPPRPSSDSTSLRVSKITIPDSLRLETQEDEDGSDDEMEEDIDLANEGARLVRISPNRQWLSVVTPDSRVLIVKLAVEPPADPKSKVTITFESSVFELPRQDRPGSAPRAPPPPITDTPSKRRPKRLAPRVDEGDLETYPRTINHHLFSSTSDLLAVSDLSGYLDTYILANSTWKLNPKNPLLPRLNSSLSTLTFRPSFPSPSPPSTSSTTNPEDRLILITSKENHILELHLTTGVLSDWSRRNPPTHLPLEFRKLKPHATGTFFETSQWEAKQRLWIWSANWLWMFDLLKDLPEVKPRAEAARGKLGSGAGHKRVMTGGLVVSGPIVNPPLPTPVKTNTVGTVTDSEWEGEGYDDDEDGGGASRAVVPTSTQKKRNKGGVKGAFWSSNRYKNMLGFLPVGCREEILIKGEGWKSGQVLEAMEMVVVERPMWDVKMPPRFCKDAGSSARGGTM